MVGCTEVLIASGVVSTMRPPERLVCTDVGPLLTFFKNRVTPIAAGSVDECLYAVKTRCVVHLMVGERAVGEYCQLLLPDSGQTPLPSTVRLWPSLPPLKCSRELSHIVMFGDLAYS